MNNSYINTQKPVVSVIVPAYNVENYIKKCIYSILKQTVKNIEIIIVDDGSKDHTGELLDELAKCDERIFVIHKKNGGVSAARNSGLDIATGKYVTFVDGDDYLEPDYLEYMLDMAKNTGAEFCLSKCCFTKKGESQTKNEDIQIMDKVAATALLLSPAVIVGCWNKIFKKSLLDDNDIRFLDELFYGEGLCFITTVVQYANFVAVGNRKVYYYRRNNQTSATTQFTIESVHNGEKSIDKIEKNMIVRGQVIDEMLILHKSMYSIGALVKLIENNVVYEYEDDYDRWLSYIRKNIRFVLMCRNISLYRKLLLLGGCISPYLMSKLDVIRKKYLVDNSVAS